MGKQQQRGRRQRNTENRFAKNAEESPRRRSKNSAAVFRAPFKNGNNKSRRQRGPQNERWSGASDSAEKVDFEGVLQKQVPEHWQLLAQRTLVELRAMLHSKSTNKSQGEHNLADNMGLSGGQNATLVDLLPHDTTGGGLSGGPAFVPLFSPSRSYARPTAGKSSSKATSDSQDKAKKISSNPNISQLLLSKKTPLQEPIEAEKLGTAPADLLKPLSDEDYGILHLDEWQKQALDALLAGANVVVDAPTSAGKTRVIEALLDAKMQEGIKLVYTTPVKSLSNDKFREFSEKYGKENVGINTGDFKENLTAPIVIATLETYRNSLIGVEPNMQRRIVVYDEYHYLQDESRGSAWEESIILTPKKSQLILLSASVPNAEEFAQWIEGLFQKPTKVIRVDKRPVPLVDLVFTKYGWLFGKDLNLSTDDLAGIVKLANAQKQRKFLKQKEEIADLLEPLNSALENELGPVVVYAGRRASVEAIAMFLAKKLTVPFAEADKRRLQNRINELPGWEYVPADLQRLVLRYGIAFHHSGMIPPGRVAIETLLKEGLLRICTGTMGISLGVNFAVRSAIISDESRPSEGGETRYSNSEILQMLGRAGRRGHDKQGFSLWVNLARYAQQRPRARENCRSSLKFDPTTVLGLLGQHKNLAFLAEFYRKSFFMRGKDQKLVLVEDHDLISGILYQKMGDISLGCNNIPSSYSNYHKGKKRSAVPCSSCAARTACHELMAQARKSALSRIVDHLQKVGCLKGETLTKFGQLARYFPQAGGLIVAYWISTGQFGAHNFSALVQAMAVFCAAHFKEISAPFADRNMLSELKLPLLLAKFYPEELFPELYDEPNFRGGFQARDSRIFRECNLSTASIVSGWLEKELSWEQLVEEHGSKYFSAGDCMMVLFRFSTLLQSCARLDEFDPSLAQLSRAALKKLLREPLDARNRMLQVEEPEVDETIAPEANSLEELPPLVVDKVSLPNKQEASEPADFVEPVEPVDLSERPEPVEPPAGHRRKLNIFMRAKAPK